MELQRATSLASTPSPAIYGSVSHNYYPQTSASYAVDIPSPEYGRRTNYVEMAWAIWKRDGEKIKHAPSVTWVGDVIDWVFGWGPKNVTTIDKEREPTTLSQQAQCVERIYDQMSQEIPQNKEKKKEATQVVKERELRRIAEAAGTVYAGVAKEVSSHTMYQELGDLPVLYVNHTYEHCPTLKQTTKMTLNESFEELGASAKNPKWFPIGLSLCLDQRVGGDYYSKVEALPFSESCLIKPGDLIEQEISPVTFEVYPLYNETYYIFDQSKISFSEKLVNGCYNENLKQEVNNQTDPSTQYLQAGLSCAQGDITIEYPSFYCNLNLSSQNWTLALSLFGESSIIFPYYDKFINEYCDCSAGKVVPLYFQWVKGNGTKCSFPESKNQSLSYQIGDEGAFTVFAADGVLADQLNVLFPVDEVQQCFNEAYDKYAQKSKRLDITVTSLLLASLVGTAALLSGYATYKTKWYKQCQARCLKQNPPANIQEYEEIV